MASNFTFNCLVMKKNYSLAWKWIKIPSMRFGRHKEGWCDNAWAHKLKFLTLSSKKGRKCRKSDFYCFEIYNFHALIEKFPQLDPLFIIFSFIDFPQLYLCTLNGNSSIHERREGVKIFLFSIFSPYSLFSLHFHGWWIFFLCNKEQANANWKEREKTAFVMCVGLIPGA